MSGLPPYLGDERPPVRTLFGLPLNQKIRTGEKQVPWSGVFMLSVIWFTWGFNIFAGGVALTFTIHRYTKNPQIISLIMTTASVIILGPIISYLSDQIWTRAGRRRPFIIIAWLGAFLSMASFAFLPAIAGFINHGLTAIGLKPVGELLVLAVMIFCYFKMWDGAAPLEPLFLECVPSHQRGRFWAIRGMLFSLAVTMFYQILWKMYDRNIDMFDWLGHPGVLYMTGEQSIYILASGLFFLTGIYLVFCVEETRLPEAPNKSLRAMFLGGSKSPARPVHNPDHISIRAGSNSNALKHETSAFSNLRQIPIIAFVLDMLRDVFFKASNFPYYIVLIIPGIESMIWGNYNQLMQNDQFRYSKQAQADWAFPMQLMAVFVLPVFAGWYSDIRVNIRWWLRILMLIVSAGAFVAMLKVLRIYSPQDIRALPSFTILSVLTVLATLSMVLLYIPTVETMLDFAGREHARAWVSLLTVVKSMITTALLYIYILHCQDQTPPILVWMLFSVVGSALNALMDTFIGPMIYDYMPPSQMGTINSGKGIIESFVKFGAANMGAWWIVFFSVHVRTPVHSKYDYTSMYILQFMLFVPAIVAKLYFIRLIATDKVKKWRTAETEARLESAAEDLALVAETGTR